MNHLALDEYDIHLCWVPGHADIRGNEHAVKKFNPVWYSTLIQLKWEESINKLHDIQPSVGKPPQIYRVSRRDQVVLSHCRIGHSALTHAFLFQGEPALECLHWQSNTFYWIVWIWWPCTNNFILQTTCMSFFTKVKEENILAFLRAAGLYNCI